MDGIDHVWRSMCDLGVGHLRLLLDPVVIESGEVVMDGWMCGALRRTLHPSAMRLP